MKWGPIVQMFCSVVLFTLANVCVKELSFIPTTQLVFMRSLVSLTICAVYVWRLKSPFFGVNKKWLLIRGFFGMIALSLFFYTIQNIPLASATTIQYLSPVFTVILAMLFLKQRVKRIQWVYLGIAMLGIALVKGFDPRVSLGFLAIGTCSAFLAAVAYFATMKCKTTDHPVTIVMYFHLLATPIMGLVSIENWLPISSYEWGLGIVIGVFSVIAQVLMAMAIHREDAAIITPIKYIGALLALSIGYFYFDEELSTVSLLGIFLVILGVTLNTLSKRSKKAKAG